MKACALAAILLLFWVSNLAAIKVERRTPNGRVVVEMPLERYVEAALAGESSVFQSTEALKAMAIAARTYAVRLAGRHAAEKFDFCDTTHCQRLDVNAITPRLESAAAETAGELLWFEGKPAFTPYTADCGGRGEDAAAVWPDMAASYLTRRNDPYCTRTAPPAWRWSAAPQEIAEALRRSGLHAPRSLDAVAVADRTGSGRPRTLRLSGGGEWLRISASSFRFALGRELGWNILRSSSFEVRANGGRLMFEGTGAGHGVGLCQRGAEQMGLAGNSYRQILAQYYPGTLAGLTGRGLSWQRLGGELLWLFTTRPDADRSALALAERTARSLSLRTGWPVPSDLEIRAYPDVATFRNATAEPGWVAARTDGRRIHIQPVAVLESRGVLASTLAHELVHAFVESQAVAGLPVWFREGLAGYLVRAQGGAGNHAVAESGLRSRASEAGARRAYADAVAAVSRLAERYGEAAVLSWVKRGLPPDVTNANPSQPATKSR